MRMLSTIAVMMLIATSVAVWSTSIMMVCAMRQAHATAPRVSIDVDAVTNGKTQLPAQPVDMQ